MFLQTIFLIAVSFFCIYGLHQGWLFIRDKYSRKIQTNLYSSQIDKYQSILKEQYETVEENFQEELLRFAESV